MPKKTIKQRPLVQKVVTPKIRIGTWNIGSLTSKSIELEEVMVRRKLDIICLQELKWKNAGNKARFLNFGTKAYKLIYHGETDGRNGIGIAVKADLLQNFISIRKENDRLICLKMVIGKGLEHN